MPPESKLPSRISQHIDTVAALHGRGNSGLSRRSLPVDTLPFFWMQDFDGLVALLLTVLVLITQK